MKQMMLLLLAFFIAPVVMAGEASAVSFTFQEVIRGDTQFVPLRLRVAEKRQEIYCLESNKGEIWIYSYQGKRKLQLRIEGLRDFAVDRQGRMYVIDRMHPFPQIYSFHGRQEGEFRLRKLPSACREPLFSQIEIGPDEKVYLVEQKNNVVLVASLSGEVTQVFGELPEQKGIRFQQIGPIHVSPKRVYICDAQTGHIYVFRSRGDFLFRFGEIGMMKENFSMPSAIWEDAQGNILVVDRMGHSISLRDSYGRFQIWLGHSGQENGDFNYPVSLAMDSQNRVYVSDLLHRIQIFTLVVPEAPPQPQKPDK